ncbi:PTS cellobiose transporter subunit IIC [Aerococcus tenax]|uniref:PTS cellobiose transporter subunit IIC n=1 Tax=Aerococcus tenax TaxID=3078812 RepID=UPI000DCC6187|nr:PTS cellobiose transporter subunit IIC [Aerococcus tenax]KAA9297510.1 PTS cellobiose transporter subunit IIC [Aerococcus tenax]MDL5208245.1 PTS cellobiose transporter subunit IIC [Aerococcus tenax]WIW72880.1 PTS cellobiose transporter subunit IIC [Aerococcus tenax]WOZ53037.1 PTS cellobiose transporter subunit IIC [Aerococcus tenax]
MSENNKINNWMDKYILGPLGTFSQYKFVRAITNTGMGTIPFTIVGSMFLVINVLPQAFPSLQGFYEATFFKFSDLYMLANKATMGILALYFNILLGYELTKIYADEEDLDLSAINGGLLSAFAFFMTIPNLVMEGGVTKLVHLIDPEADVQIVNGWSVGADGLSRLGTVGIFTGIIMATIAVMIYRFCVKKNITIKLPEAVPAGVANSFTALIPAFAIAIVVLLINALLLSLGYDIFTILEVPFGFITNLANSWLGLVVIYIIMQALWFVGIHGATLVTSFLQPITFANLTANVAGASIPFAGEFNNAYVTIGGSGATLVLCFWLATRAKSEQLSAIGKASAVPALFNINEPLIFGIPFLYNVDLMIPWFLAPIASMTVGYIGIASGFARPVIAQMAWPTPVGLGAFIGSGGDIKAGILALACAAVAFLVYYPFIRSYDKKLLLQEQEAMKEMQ